MTNLTNMFRGPARRRAPAILAWLTVAAFALTTLAAPAGAVEPNVVITALGAYKPFSGRGSNAVAGQTAKIYMDLRNDGNADPGAFGVKFYVNGAVVHDGTDGPLAPGASKTVEIDYTFPSSGSFQVKGEAIGISGPTNGGSTSQEVTVTIDAPPVPDIVNDAVRAFKYGGQPTDAPVAGELASIQMDLRNGGQAASGSFTTVYYVNGAQIATENHADMAPGATHTTGVTYTFPSAGSYQLRAEATNVTGEQNTADNSREITVTVNPAPAPDLDIRDLRVNVSEGVEANPVYVGTQYTLQPLIRNSGTASIDDWTHNWFDNGVQVYTWPYGSHMEPGQEIWSGHPYTFQTAGAHTIRYLVTNVAGEINTSNNEQTITVTVVTPGPPLTGSWYTSAYPPELQQPSALGPYYLPITITGDVYLWNVTDLRGVRVVAATRTGTGEQMQADMSASHLSGVYQTTPEGNGTSFRMAANTGSNPSFAGGGVQPYAQWLPFRMEIHLDGTAFWDLNGDRINMTIPSGDLDAQRQWYANFDALIRSTANYPGHTQFRNLNMTGAATPPAVINLTNENNQPYLSVNKGADILSSTNLTNQSPSVTVNAGDDIWMQMECFAYDAGGGNHSSPDPALSSRFDFYVDGVLTAQQTGTFGQNGYNWGLADWFHLGVKPAGTYQIRAVADAASQVNETNESDNEATVTVTVNPTPAPDIEVMELRVWDLDANAVATTIYPGRRYDMQCRLKNVGNAAGSNWTNNFYMNGVSFLAGPYFTTYQPGEERWGGYDYTFPSAGSYTFRLLVTNVSGEQNITNNSREITVTVVSPDFSGDFFTHPGGGAGGQSSFPTTLYSSVLGPYYLPVTVTGEMYLSDQPSADYQRGMIVISKTSSAHPPGTDDIYAHLPSAAWNTGNQLACFGDAVTSGLTPRGSWRSFNLTFNTNGMVTFTSPSDYFTRNISVAQLSQINSSTLYVYLAANSTSQAAGGVRFKNVSATGGSAAAPEIEIVSFGVEPASPVAGQSVGIGGTIRNSGNANSGQAIQKYYVNGTVLFSDPAAQILNDIPPGEERTPGIQYTFPSAGTYQVKYEVSGVVGELNTTNNSWEATVTVNATPAPDIEVMELRVWDVEANAVATTIVHGKLYDMQARLKNVGAAEGGNWTNNYYMNGSSFLAGPYNTTYAVGEERWTGYDYTFPAAGSYTFRFLVTGVSGENNTANNEKSLTVTVVNPPAPDVEIIGLALDPVSPSAGVPAEITASYENRGDAPTGEFVIRYLVNGAVVGEAAAATLSPGANAQKTFAYTFPAEGNVTIAAVAVNVSGEIALGNNQRDLAATVGPRPPEGVLSASPSTLDFGTVKPGDAAENKSFSATIDGGAGAFNLTVSSSAGWFTTDVQRDQGGVVAMPRTGGLYNQTVTITDVDFSNLAEGQHASVVTVAAPEPIGSKQVTVRVEIENPQPAIVVGVTEFDLGSFLATEAPADRTFEISNAGTGELTGTLTTAAAWIAVTPTAFTTAPSAATEARLAFDLSGLAEGAHTGKVTVASNGGPDHEITVQVEVIAADADPELAVSDDRIAFGSVEIAAPGADAKPYEKTVFVRNSGGGSVSWRARSDAEWVSVTPGEATAMEREVEVKIAIDPARLTEGKNEARLTIEATELGQSVEIEVTAEGMKVARLWDLEMTPTTIEVGGGGKTERLSRGQLDVGARGGERFSIRIAVGARNLDLGLAERAVVAAVKSWRPGEVVTVGKIEGGAERRLNYSEAFELPARTGIYYVGLLMGGVHEGEEAAGFDRLPVNGGQGNPIGNGNDVWDPPTSAWEGAATNGFFLHDLDGDGENRRWPAVVVKIRVTGVDPARRRLAEGDVRIVGVEYAGEVVDAANVKLIPRGGTGEAAPLDNQPPMANRPGATHASPLRDGPSSVERPGAGDHGARHAVPLRIRAVVRNPAGGDDGVAVLRVLVLPTLPGMPGRILDDVTIGPGNEREIEWTADVRTPRGEGIHYVGIVVGREEELREIRSQGLARNAMEEGIQNGRTALLLAANENRPADFAVRAVRLATEQPPAIEAIPAALIVKADQDGGNVAEGVVRLRNVAGGLLEGNAAASEAWVQARPQAFVGNEVEIRIRVDVAEFLRNRALRGSAGSGAGGGPAENVIPSGVIAITTSGGDVLVPISVEIPKGGAIPPPGSLTIHEVRADGPFPKLRWRAEAPGGRYRLTVRDALTGKTGWSVEIGDEENGAIDYAGFPLIPNREYIIAIRHTSWNAPVERRFRVADYRVGW